MSPIDSLPGALGPSEVQPRAVVQNPGVSGTAGASFSGTLSKALQEVDGIQQSADAQAESVAQGNGNLHDAAIAMEKADISMRFLVNVRNKVISAYQDIMKMGL
jgi:flagellar hook-basal body complex protein FliE